MATFDVGAITATIKLDNAGFINGIYDAVNAAEEATATISAKISKMGKTVSVSFGVVEGSTRSAREEVKKSSTGIVGSLQKIIKFMAEVAKNSNKMRKLVGAPFRLLAKSLVKVKTTLGKVSNAFFGLKSAIAAAVGAVGAFKLVGLAEKGSQVAAAFQRLSLQLGSDAPLALRKLRAATKGTVSDLGIMQQVSNAAILGVGKSIDEMTELFEIGRRLGAATGRTAEQALGDIVIGIGRQSRLILDNLGLVVRVTDANQEYADSLNRTVDSLTDEERRQIFLNAALKAGRLAMGKLGEEVETFAIRLQRLRASFSNYFTHTAVQIAPAMSKVIKSIHDLSMRFGGSFRDSIIVSLKQGLSWLSDFIDTNGPRILAFFQKVSDAANLVGAGLKTFITGSMKRIVEIWEKPELLAELFIQNLQGQLTVWVGIGQIIAGTILKVIMDWSPYIWAFVKRLAATAASSFGGPLAAMLDKFIQRIREIFPEWMLGSRESDLKSELEVLRGQEERALKPTSVFDKGGGPEAIKALNGLREKLDDLDMPLSFELSSETARQELNQAQEQLKVLQAMLEELKSGVIGGEDDPVVAETIKGLAKEIEEQKILIGKKQAEVSFPGSIQQQDIIDRTLLEGQIAELERNISDANDRAAPIRERISDVEAKLASLQETLKAESDAGLSSADLFLKDGLESIGAGFEVILKNMSGMTLKEFEKAIADQVRKTQELLRKTAEERGERTAFGVERIEDRPKALAEAEEIFSKLEGLNVSEIADMFEAEKLSLHDSLTAVNLLLAQRKNILDDESLQGPERIKVTEEEEALERAIVQLMLAKSEVQERINKKREGELKAIEETEQAQSLLAEGQENLLGRLGDLEVSQLELESARTAARNNSLAALERRLDVLNIKYGREDRLREKILSLAMQLLDIEDKIVDVQENKRFDEERGALEDRVALMRATLVSEEEVLKVKRKQATEALRLQGYTEKQVEELMQLITLETELAGGKEISDRINTDADRLEVLQATLVSEEEIARVKRQQYQESLISQGLDETSRQILLEYYDEELRIVKQINEEREKEARLDMLSGNVAGALMDGLRTGENSFKNFAKRFAGELEYQVGEAVKSIGDLLGDVLGDGLNDFFGSEAFAGILGLIGALFSQESNESISEIPGEDIVTSSTAIRGVVAGPDNIAISEVGSSIREANRGVESLLTDIRGILQSMEGNQLSTGGLSTGLP